MLKFSDFAKEELPIEGKKVAISDLLNKEIIVQGYRVSDSKKREGTKYITLSILLDNEKCVAFTGSNVLLGQLERYKDKLPFSTVIKKIDKFFTFT